MKPVLPLGPRILTGKHVALEPITEAHQQNLQQAADDESIWRFMPVQGFGTHFPALWDGLTRDVARGERIAFAVRRLSDNTIVGSTSYLAIMPAHARVEIGWTWYAPSAQATNVNPEAKFLLLQNAFEAALYHRVEFKTDANNARSRAAILKLGAREEGIFRGHMWMPRGYWRDSVYYSVLDTEWPEIKRRLQARMDAA
jgi:RimJ/RimL family protein N-acetyltransferase